MTNGQVLPLLFYSANTSLAYDIAEQFYGGVHYVWCSPVARASHAAAIRRNPGTSDPFKIYADLVRTTDEDDRDCPKVRQNRIGLLHGAEVKHSAGVIDQDDFTVIVEMIEKAGTNAFKPLLYVIPFASVDEKVIPVRPSDKANVMSREFKIVDLKSEEFDVLVLPRV